TGPLVLSWSSSLVVRQVQARAPRPFLPQTGPARTADGPRWEQCHIVRVGARTSAPGGGVEQSEYRLERSPDAEDPEHLVTGGREQSGPVEHQSGQGTGIVMGSLDARALTGLEPIECGDRVITVSGDLVGEHRGRFHGHARADACCREEPGRGVAEEDRAADRPPPGSGIAQRPEERILGRTDRLEAGVDARAHLLELRPDLAGEPSRTQRLTRIRTAEEDSDAVL